MRALLPEPLAAPDVHQHYAQDWLGQPGWRVNFVASVDGAASASGRSRGLQTPGDHQVFTALRDLADVVVVGAGTATAEGYRPARLAAARLAVRRAYGLAERLPIAVVTGRLDLDVTAPLYQDADTLIVTCAAAPAELRAALADRVTVLVCGDDAVDLPAARTALAGRGLSRALCEGGPTLFAHAVDAGIVDELCLSVTPFLLGPGAGRITAGSPLDRPVDLELVGLLEEDGAQFGRYALRPSRMSR